MRLFIALEIPDAVRDAIDARVSREKRHLPATRWVRPEGMHLTLAFLGETEEGRVPALHAALAEACGANEAFSLRVAGAGTFPPKKPARVAWLGIRPGAGGDGDLLAVMRLQRQVEKAACGAVGIEPERRPFHPHLTLGRPRTSWPRPAVDRFLAAFEGEYGEPFAVRRGVLVRSFLEPGGARYELVGEYPLQRPAAGGEGEA